MSKQVDWNAEFMEKQGFKKIKGKYFFKELWKRIIKKEDKYYGRPCDMCPTKTEKDGVTRVRYKCRNFARWEYWLMDDPVSFFLCRTCNKRKIYWQVDPNFEERRIL